MTSNLIRLVQSANTIPVRRPFMGLSESEVSFGVRRQW